MYTDYQQNYSAMVNQSDAERNSAMDQLLNKYRFEKTQDLSVTQQKINHSEMYQRKVK